jgi:hypothetical protein
MALQTRASAKGLLWKSTAVASSNISRISSRGKLNIGEWGREPIKDIEPRRIVLVRAVVDTVDMTAGSKEQKIVHGDGDGFSFRPMADSSNGKIQVVGRAKAGVLYCFRYRC